MECIEGLEGINMDDVSIGRNFLIQTIGEDFCRKYMNSSVFAYGQVEEGVYCFWGITLNPSDEPCGLSSAIDDWDIYAICYVNEGKITAGECRLPQESVQESIL